MMDDRTLIEQAQAGDAEAFSRLVAQHHQMLYRLCYRLTQHAADAEDLAHDAFVEAFLKLAQLRDAERFAPWLRTIALNLYRMALRHTQPVSALTEEIPAQEHGQDGPLSARLSHGLSQLSAPHRLALVLHYLAGLSYEEIATFLDVPIGTVMSRLHRGRSALKRLVEETTDEEIPLMTDDIFTREVDAEIATLLELSRQQPAAVERLSVLLAHAPERFARLISEAADDEVLTNVARLLRRLGRTAIEVALNEALSEDPTACVQARRLLVIFIARLRQWVRGGPALIKMAPVEVYLLLDALIRSSASDDEKAALLVTLLDASDDEPISTLLTTVLMSYPDAAFWTLQAHFRQEAGAAELSIPIVSALARMGTRFVETLITPLASDDPAQRMLALQGLEAFARSRYSRKGEPGAQTLRSAGKWAPVPEELIDTAIEQRAVQRVIDLLADQDSAIRTRAVRVLGLIRAVEARPALERLLDQADAATRVVTLRALAELGVPESIPALLRATKSATAPERRAAVDALGRLHATKGLEAVLVRLDDADASVRQAAIVALGEIGGADAKALLQLVMKGQDKAMARTAARVLHTSPHYSRPIPPNTALDALDERVKAYVRGEEASPQSFISLYAAIAALPEIRPYEEREVTRFIAQACIDYSTTRRQLIMEKLMARARGIYTLTDAGQSVWRVEHFIGSRYLK